jgi:hypothetical protein
MKKHEIEVGGRYRARVNNRVVTVQVEAIREDGLSFRVGRSTGRAVRYDVRNIETGRRTTFRSAARFRCKEKVGTLELMGMEAPLPVAPSTHPPDETAPHPCPE